MFRLREFLKENNVTDNKQAYSLYDIAVSKGYDKCADSYKRASRKAVASIVSEAVTETKVDVVKKIDSKGVVDATIRCTYEIKTVEEMAKYCSIDLKLYEASAIIAGHWGNGAIGGNNNNFQFKVRFTPIYKKGELTPYDAADIFKDLIKDVEPPKFNIPKMNIDKSSNTVLFGQCDEHIGDLIWGDESSAHDQQNYDLKIAEKMYNKAADYYCSYYKNKRVKEIIVPIGGDFLDIDNNENATINGTVQVVDARPRKIWLVGFRLMISIIDKLSTIAPIRAFYLPGNHDSTVSYYLAMAVEAYYRNDPNIIVDTSPTDRKYFKIGDTLICWTHTKTIGKAIKLEKLPAIMSHEARELWGKTKNHEIIVEHYHAERNITIGVNIGTTTQDIGSTIIRVLPTLFPNNYWSNSSGYNAVQQMHCLEYNPKHIEEIKIYRP